MQETTSWNQYLDPLIPPLKIHFHHLGPVPPPKGSPSGPCGARRPLCCSRPCPLGDNCAEDVMVLGEMYVTYRGQKQHDVVFRKHRGMDAECFRSPWHDTRQDPFPLKPSIDGAVLERSRPAAAQRADGCEHTSGGALEGKAGCGTEGGRSRAHCRRQPLDDRGNVAASRTSRRRLHRSYS